MKKILMMAAAVAMTAMTMVSCDGNNSADLKDSADTLAYDFGVAQSAGLKQVMTMQLGIDSTYMDEFIKGMREGAVNKVDPKKDAYLKGLEIGQQVQQMAKAIGQQVYGEDYQDYQYQEHHCRSCSWLEESGCTFSRSGLQRLPRKNGSPPGRTTSEGVWRQQEGW